MKNTLLKISIPFSVGLLGFLALNSCFVGIPKGATAIQNFEAEKYLGTWYEIARFDHKFELNIDNATANYSLNTDGSIKVVNRGYNYTEKKWKESIGEARFVGNKNEAMLKVSFFKPIWAGYNVIDLVDYKYALVVGNSTKYMWILSREKNIPEEIKQRFLTKSKNLGFPVESLIWVSQDKN